MSSARIHPLWTMIYRPRDTMKHILQNYPNKWVHTLAIVGAFTHIANSSSFYWNTWWATLLIWLFMSVITGLLTLYVFGALVKWTGSWLKGKSSYAHIRSALAWSQIPIIYFFIVDVILLLILRGATGNLFYASVRFVFAVWGLVIFLCCLQVVQGFTFFRSLMNYVISVVILLVFLIIVNVIILFVSRPTPVNMTKTTAQNFLIPLLSRW